MFKPILIAFFITSSLLSFGQENKEIDSPYVAPGLNLGTLAKNTVLLNTRICICCKPRGDTSGLPLFVINDTLMINDFKHFILNSKTIENIDIVKQSKALNQYGDKAKFGAVLITINDNIKLLNLTNLLDHFKIDLQDRNLPICVDEEFITYPEKIKADITAVKGITITEGKYWFYTKQIDTSHKFINIITK